MPPFRDPLQSRIPCRRHCDIESSQSRPHPYRLAEDTARPRSSAGPRGRLRSFAANALVAQRISSVNALSAMCESVGADIDEVSFAIGLDARIGSRILKASVGLGGSCFRKDILSLAYIAESLHLFEVADYWRAIVDINEYQKDRFTRRFVQCLYNSLRGKTLAVFGFAYKKDTGDTRETAAITVIDNVLTEGANVKIYDPLVKEAQIKMELKATMSRLEYAEEQLVVCESAYDACAGADAVIILTEWTSLAIAQKGGATRDMRGGRWIGSG
ncbi:hypothetical protein BU23DRAFT_604421 [Bimuria novae-zelandiae CBS 107.79]|uniref:UDP-glucose 6-dehydrogenase n=1 Tax=Bimuria novae-zelandiae CBS 107.79 TaxID=1447943 RepID=A0A6A5UQ66_9PLEO|nr:hypothetical protein BU23DRAFT_604421 [Bimuria novae-zelandiae CBS 107.79]